MASAICATSTPVSGRHSIDGQVRRLRPALGTLCAIEAVGKVRLKNAIDHAFDAIQRVQQLMHPMHGDDLSRLNFTTGQVISINEWTWQVLQLSKRLNELSDGVFDPCLPIKPGCTRDIELLTNHQVVCHAPVMIDLGGIAKGFAIDRAIDALKLGGCDSGLVNAGGDVRVFGESQNLNMCFGEHVYRMELSDKALAVSQFHQANRPAEHQGYYQRNVKRLPLHKYAAVLATTTVVADALTKCGLLLAPDRCETLTKNFDAQILFAK